MVQQQRQTQELPTPPVRYYSLGSSVGDNGSGNNQIAYCFHERGTGYSKFGSYSGNGSSTGPVVTLGFSPAFVMIKGTSASRSWVMYDNTRQPSNPKDLRVLADSSDFEFDVTNTLILLELVLKLNTVALLQTHRVKLTSTWPLQTPANTHTGTIRVAIIMIGLAKVD